MWLSAFAAGCATAPSRPGEAARETRAFIAAARTLGVSAASDTAALAAMTGAPVVTEIRPIPFRDAPHRHEASGGFLARDRLVASFSYVYSFRADGEYFSIMRLRLEPGFDCVRLADLARQLGTPARLPAAPPAAGARRDRVWAAEYSLPSGASATFVFGPGECASSLNVAVNLG